MGQEVAFDYLPYHKSIVDKNTTPPYDVYGFENVLADKWPVFDYADSSKKNDVDGEKVNGSKKTVVA